MKIKLKDTEFVFEINIWRKINDKFEFIDNLIC